MRVSSATTRLIRAGLSVCAATLLAGTAGAQITPFDEDLLAAEVVDVDRNAREITVQFDENDAVETYEVADDAEFFLWDGVMERPREFDDIVVGTRIGLEFEGLEGEQTLSKVVTNGQGG